MYEAPDRPRTDTRDKIAAELARFYSETRPGTPEPAPYSLARVVQALADPHRGLSGRELEVSKAASILAGENRFMGTKPYIPWAALAERAMATSPGSKGGYMVNVEGGALADALRPHSAIVAAGATIVPDLENNVSFPTVATKGAGFWVAEGVAPPSDSDPALGSASLTPRTAIAKLRASLQLLRSPAAEQVLRTSLLRDLGELIDIAAISGPGGAAPLGILNTPGITSVSGTAITWASIAGMRQTILEAGAREADLFFLAAPNVEKILTTREKVSGSGFIWSNGTVDGVPARATRHVPDGLLILGTAAQLAIGSWGPGPAIEVSQSTGFNTAQVDIRVMAMLDIAVLQAKAFAIATAVT